MKVCTCGGPLVARAGRRYLKQSDEYKYTMRCKSCGGYSTYYVKPNGEVTGIGSRPTGRPDKIQWATP